MKLSIITINLNNADGLRKTIESVVNQSWIRFEYIVIDGASNDKSIDVIRQYEDKIDFWISEPDKGIFNAMNKGVKKAKGEYLLMLNSGDYLCDNKVLDRVFNTTLYKEGILSGDIYRESKGKIFEEWLFPDELTFSFFRKGSLGHQATFIKRELHEKIGLYDENLKYASDWKFFILAICKYNVSYRHLPFFVTNFNCEGLTCKSTNFPKMQKEGEAVYQEFFPTFINDYLTFEEKHNKALNTQILGFKRKVHYYLKNKWHLFKT